MHEKEDCELVVQTTLSEKVGKKRQMARELAEDEPLASPDTDFKAKVHNVIVDTVTVSEEVYSQCKNFAQI